MQRGGASHSFKLFYVYTSLLNLLNNLQRHARCFYVYGRFCEEVYPSGVRALKIKTTGSRGQISVALILVMTVILGAIGLGADMALLYFNWVILQKGVDAAALAGAGYLEGDSQAAAQAVAIAKTYAEKNGIKDAELTTDGGGNVAYVPGPNYNTITVTAKRTVPYTFFKLIGLSNGKVPAQGDRPDATAPACVNCTGAIATPGAQPTVIPGNICSTVGQCDVIPIGLDWSAHPTRFNTVGHAQLRVRSVPVTGVAGVGRQWGLQRTHQHRRRLSGAACYQPMGGHRAWVQKGSRRPRLRRSHSRRPIASTPDTFLAHTRQPARGHHSDGGMEQPQRKKPGTNYGLCRVYGSIRSAVERSRPISSRRKPSTVPAIRTRHIAAPAEGRS